MFMIRDRMEKAELNREQVGLLPPMVEVKLAKNGKTKDSIQDTDKSDEKSGEMNNGLEDFDFTQVAGRELNQTQQPLKIGKQESEKKLVNFEDDMKGDPIGSINNSIDIETGSKSAGPPPTDPVYEKHGDSDVIISKVD